MVFLSVDELRALEVAAGWRPTRDRVDPSLGYGAVHAPYASLAARGLLDAEYRLTEAGEAAVRRPARVSAPVAADWEDFAAAARA